MSNVIKFESSTRRRTAIEQTACTWLARLEAGASDEEMKALSAWLFESGEHVEVFFEVCAAWDQLSVLAELSEIFPLEKYRAPAGRQVSWARRAAVAACLALTLAFAGTALDHGFDGWLTTRGVVDGTTYKTDVGQRSTVTLPDHSEIMLNTNTLIEVRYSGTERRIVLEKGEALFTVTRDSARPFRVVAGSHVVEAIGTEFTVQKAIDDSIEVMVKEGVVGFRSIGEKGSDGSAANDQGEDGLEGAISLVAGEMVTSEGRDSENIERLNIPLEEIESRLSWRYGLVVFQDDPLDQVIREISRYTTTVILTDDDVGNIRVDGSFRVGDIDALLLAMQENFGLEIMKLGNGTILLSKTDTD